MADPTKKVTFRSSDPDQPVQAVAGLINSLTGTVEDITFKDGSFTTSDPGLIPALELHGQQTGLFSSRPPKK